MRPELGAMSTPVMSLSWPRSSSWRRNWLPDLPYSSTLFERATARVLRSAEKEWSAIGAWKRWCTSGEAMVDDVLFDCGKRQEGRSLYCRCCGGAVNVVGVAYA